MTVTNKRYYIYYWKRIENMYKLASEDTNEVSIKGF